MQTENSFAEGMDRSSDDRIQKNTSIFDSVNGTLYNDQDGNVIYRPTEGNERILIFDTDQLDPDTGVAVHAGASSTYAPFGGCSFEDCMVVITMNPANDVIIWVFQMNEDERAYGQVLFSDRSYPITEKFDHRRTNNIKVRPVFENENLYRIYWCDGIQDDSQPVRALTFKQNGTITNPTYAGATIIGDFKLFEKVGVANPQSTNLMAPFKQGIIHFRKRVIGSLLSGRYVYLYRLIRADGYRTPWSHHTQPVFVTTDIIDGSSSWHMHEYEMEASGVLSSIGNQLIIYGVDQDYAQIEVAYVYIPDGTNPPTIASSFIFVDITSHTHIIDHIDMNGEPQNVDELISSRLNIRAAQTLDIKDNHLWIGNYKTGSLSFTDQEIEDVFANVKVHHIFRDMKIDIKGKTDASNPSDGNNMPCFTTGIVNSETSTVKLNQDQDLVYAVESDYPSYRGQQIDNTFVGYPRDETARYAIVFWDLEGNPGFAYHVCDYRFPKMFNGSVVGDVSATRIRTDGSIQNVVDPSAFTGVTGHANAWLTTTQGDLGSISDPGSYPNGNLERPVIDGDDAINDMFPSGYTNMNMTYARIMGIMFHGIDVSGIQDRISGFSIHRVRMEWTTLAQGIINPCMLNSDGSNSSLRPSCVPYLTAGWDGTWYSPIMPHNQFITHGHGTFAPNTHFEPFWDRNTVTGSGCGAHNYLRYVPDFAQFYVPEFMFDPGQIPSYDIGHKLELVQLCWEEFNHMMQIPSRRYPNEGPSLCNMIYRDFDTGAPPYTNEVWSTKLSYHLLVNTRHRNWHTAPHTITGDPENGYPLTGNAFYSGNATRQAAYAALWNNPQELFPLYGDYIEPDWIKRVDMNQEILDIDPVAHPGWKFRNSVKYWLRHRSGGSCLNLPDVDPYFDDYYDGRSEAFHMDADNAIDNQREGVGHDMTMLFKYSGNIKDKNGNVAPAKYIFPGIVSTFAEEYLRGADPAAEPAYRHGPHMATAARWIFNWKRPLGAVYGGQSLVALQNNIFIGTGHFQPVGNNHFETAIGNTNPASNIYSEIEVWGGETWLDLHSGAVLYPNYAYDTGVGTPSVAYPEINGGNTSRFVIADCGYVMVFPHEARTNLGLRNAPSPSNPNSAQVALRPRAGWDGNFTLQNSTGLFYYGGHEANTPDPTKHLLEEFYINDVLGYQDRFRPFVFTPRGFQANAWFPVRWHYNSTQKIYGDIVDVFREMLVNDFKDLNGEFGQIKSSVVWGDQLYSIQVMAFGKLRIYEKAALPSDEGAVVLGDSQVISGSGIDYRSEHFGTQNIFGVIATPKGIYGVDVLQRSIWFFNGQSVPMSLSDAVGMNQMLRDVLLRYKDADTIYGRKGMDIVLGYDPAKNNVHFNFPSKLALAYHPTLNTSKRYRTGTFAYNATTVIGGNPHNGATINFVDEGSSTAEQLNSSDNVIHVRDQDIIKLVPNNTPLNPVALYFNLYQGLYGSDLATPRSLTVQEFYVIVPYFLQGWTIQFLNVKATSPTLATPDTIYPNQAYAATEMEGYRYHGSNYPHTPVSLSIGHNTTNALLRLWRTEPDGPFQVQLLSVVPGTTMWEFNPRSGLVYNEDAERFERWKTFGDSFSMIYNKRMLTGVENDVNHGLYSEHDRRPELPVLYGQAFNVWLSFVVNIGFQMNKIIDNLWLDTGAKEDIRSVRFTTEEQSILIFVQPDSRIRYQRRQLRMPSRRVEQPDRLRGDYVRVEVEFVRNRSKVAYLTTAQTFFTLSNKT